MFDLVQLLDALLFIVTRLLGLVVLVRIVVTLEALRQRFALVRAVSRLQHDRLVSLREARCDCPVLLELVLDGAAVVRTLCAIIRARARTSHVQNAIGVGEDAQGGRYLPMHGHALAIFFQLFLLDVYLVKEDVAHALLLVAEILHRVVGVEVALLERGLSLLIIVVTVIILVVVVRVAV